MGRVRRARRIAAAAAYGGGGLGAGIGVLGVLGWALLKTEAVVARRVVGSNFGAAPDDNGRYGAGLGEPIEFLVLGDSTAAGLGTDTAQQTVGAVLASGISALAGRPVRLTNVAVVGAVSADLDEQVARARRLVPAADVALVMIGANDVTRRISTATAVRHLEQAVHDLVTDGTKVVVGTCPDLGTIRPIQRPLRWLAKLWSRQLAAAQTVAVIEAGGRTVSLANLLAPAFYQDPERLFSWDRFHPSAEGYAAAAGALLPTAAAALDPRFEQPLSAGEGVRTLPQAAVEAVNAGGTEVSPASVAGQDHGPDGRWAQLRHRARWPRRPLIPRQTVPVESTMETA
jgi:lysophospholipase L1-like esterase